ncbi:putative squalene-hopene cyclase [Candidatus Sulfotelmatobacter kueseliae]|uniref:Putative squalene-hopene cyclase n=1 Tax=Candidatus Sulfotelmatobacter kueseliae TaxID=2042962 RepID=A0A2U3KKR0_9BACT|nr:putative squalene-hopene cyclase [Candidatus Sulfotelmatobacter kueseliae]
MSEPTRGRVLALCLVAGCLAGCSHPSKTVNKSWDPKAAAAYLDVRETTWMGWPGSARDHGTFCVSCHTVVPYVLSRPTLRAALAERQPSDNERKILQNVTERVRLWNQVGPYYSDEGYGNGKLAESRGTEAVLNALILASSDAQIGKLSDITRMAFSNMWALQRTEGEGKGAWPWLQFGMEPWEAPDSQYYGAALAAVATGIAPENYRASPDIQEKLSLLHDYLNREYPAQSRMNRVVLLWASTKWPGLVDADRQNTIIREVSKAQQADGGWALSSLAWPNRWSLHSFVRVRLRSDWSRQSADSDGYATGLITFVLQEAGVSPQDETLKSGLSWLASSQSSEDGSWPSLSLTLRRNPSSNAGHFMRDAATAYAVLALSDSGVAASRGSMAENRSAYRSIPEVRPKPDTANQRN